MALVPAQAQIQNPSREKKPNQSNLKEEKQRRKVTLRIEAPVGIIGIPGSGRKTLAYRFANMNIGVIQNEVPVNYCYEAVSPVNFSPKEDKNPYDRYIQKLTFYIIEPPAELPVHDPPLYLEHWNDFCCLLLCFDVRNQRSFLEASLKLTAFRRQNFRIPLCILAGNKCDRRYEPPAVEVNPEDPEYVNQREIWVRDAYMEAEHLGGYYFECSAKYKIDVSAILNLIKVFAIERKYWQLEPQ